MGFSKRASLWASVRPFLDEDMRTMTWIDDTWYVNAWDSLPSVHYSCWEIGERE